jgi:L-alanine-DL-glutamate epimerase-like enolase superfamily enzyme
VELEARTETYPLAETFVISRDSSDESESVIVELHHAGHTGYGEGAPIERYDEDGASAVEFLQSCRDALGDDPFALDEILGRLPETPHTQAARAALDNALYDLCGKLTGLPVWRLLGLRRGGPPTCWTVWLGDPDDMARRAEKAATRFRRLKLKLGGGDGLDVERVRAVRTVTDLPLQVDVNEYWTVDETLEALPHLAGLGVEYCEQPLPERDPGGAQVKAASPIPIYVDEDCHTLEDVAACAERAHGINIKLSKSGGLREAIRMANAARALGLGVMLGCMTEAGLGISAGTQIASLCDFIDLDGNLLLLEDPWPGVELLDGVQLPPDQPGLGVSARKALSHPR